MKANLVGTYLSSRLHTSIKHKYTDIQGGSLSAYRLPASLPAQTSVIFHYLCCLTLPSPYQQNHFAYICYIESRSCVRKLVGHSRRHKPDTNNILMNWYSSFQLHAKRTTYMVATASPADHIRTNGRRSVVENSARSRGLISRSNGLIKQDYH